MSSHILPERLALGRHLAGLTETQVARLTGLSRTAVVLMEQGVRVLSDDEAARVAEVYDVNLPWLRGRSRSNPEAEALVAHMTTDDAARILLVLDSMREPPVNR